MYEILPLNSHPGLVTHLGWDGPRMSFREALNSVIFSSPAVSEQGLRPFKLQTLWVPGCGLKSIGQEGREVLRCLGQHIPLGGKWVLRTPGDMGLPEGLSSPAWKTPPDSLGGLATTSPAEGCTQTCCLSNQCIGCGWRRAPLCPALVSPSGVREDIVSVAVKGWQEHRLTSCVGFSSPLCTPISATELWVLWRS